MTGRGLVVHHVKGGKCLFDNKHLMTGSEGDSPASGNKINCFPRDQSVSNLLYSWKFITPRCNGGRRLTFSHSHIFLDFLDFAMLPAKRFWRETVPLLDVMCPRSNQ